MKNIPKAVGPYSAYYKAGDFLYISGQLGINPETNEIEGKTAAEQAKQSLENLKTILELNGLTMKNIVKTMVLLDDINDFVSVNEVYATYFEEPYPARSAFEVGKLPKGGLVEIEAIAYFGK
ncbi:Rid family detoxifying hydrolase [Pseudostreptobacillus hongkongensis]|uniref:Rid family detoxifying hydrolase n=1 Tax=Pseudostreptobacillus hongkongensis TaxID=1162717 RepID=UPI00082CE47D|nr:Rid family detoxifying hydrolase [Pseudostreptobacillus hongkongensis]